MSEANPAGVTILECLFCEERDARIAELEAAIKHHETTLQRISDQVDHAAKHPEERGTVLGNIDFILNGDD